MPGEQRKPGCSEKSPFVQGKYAVRWTWAEKNATEQKRVKVRKFF